MDLSLVFCLAIVADAALSRILPVQRRVGRFVCTSILFAVRTALIVALIGSPLHPVFRSQDLPHEFWLQVLTCCWWGLAARDLIRLLALTAAIRKPAVANRLLTDIIAASIYVCSALAMMGFVFGLPLRGLLATSGIIAIVLGLALQSTLSDVFSGLSLSIEKPYRVGDEILLDGGAEGEVIEMNWRSTHLKNGANDVVIVPNSAIAKMRIQNHSAASKRYNGTLSVTVDSANQPELALEILRQAAMACPSILEQPAPSAAAMEFKGDRICYDIYFSTSTIELAGEARSQLITQLYKRARPMAGPRKAGGRRVASDSLFFFSENEFFDHISVFEPLSEQEKTNLNRKIIRRQFREGEQLLKQGATVDSVQFVFSGLIQVTRQVQDGPALTVRRLGPGDAFGEISLLTGLPASGTLAALTSGLLLGLHAEDLKPILESRPELMELLSHSVVRQQQFVAMFDKSAIQPLVIEQRDLLSHIRKFFRLDLHDDR
jgi:small-conductance mechanosensitive channel